MRMPVFKWNAYHISFHGPNYVFNLFWNSCRHYRKVSKIVQRISVYLQNILNVNICCFFFSLPIYVGCININILIDIHYIHTHHFWIILLSNPSLYTWCIVRLNKPKLQRLEQRKVYCRAMQGGKLGGSYWKTQTP